MLVFEKSVDCCGCYEIIDEDGKEVGNLIHCVDWLADLTSCALGHEEIKQIDVKLTELNANKADEAVK